MSHREPDPDSPCPPLRPWTLTPEIVHLSGPPFELDQHAEAVVTEIVDRLADVVVHLPGGTRVRIETYMDTIDAPVHGLEAHP
jgi:hypothetical protein